MKLRIGVPKGSLQEATIALFKRAGLKRRIPAAAPTLAGTDDPEIECMLIRAQRSAARYVDHGALDCGIQRQAIGSVESGLEMVTAAELTYAKQSLGKVRWVLAVPEDSPFEKVAGGRLWREKSSPTELANATRNYLSRLECPGKSRIFLGRHGSEATHAVADAIVEITETGSSLRANRLRIIDTVLESNTQLIANKTAWVPMKKKRRKIEGLALMLSGAIYAQGRVGLMLNVRKGDLAAVLAVLPALQKPTISTLSDGEWVAVNTIIEETTAWKIMPKLKAAKAEGIVEYPLNKVVL